MLVAGVAEADEYLHGQAGTNYNKIGDSTYGSDGATCQKIGSQTDCN